MNALSDLLWRRPSVLLALLLAPPLLWLGVVYLGALFALLAQSFFAIDPFSGLVVREFTLATYAELFRPANLDIIVRTVTMAALVTLASIAIAFPIAYFAARHARGRWKALFYLAVMLPLWSSYLVKIYAWKMILAKEGIVSWAAGDRQPGDAARGATRGQPGAPAGGVGRPPGPPAVRPPWGPRERGVRRVQPWTAPRCRPEPGCRPWSSSATGRCVADAPPRLSADGRSRRGAGVLLANLIGVAAPASAAPVRPAVVTVAFAGPVAGPAAASAAKPTPTPGRTAAP